MPAYFDKGFVVRESAWHGLAEVLEEYPGREKAMELAGHNWNVVELPVYSDIGGKKKKVEGWKLISRDDTSQILSVCREGYQVIPNSRMWDIVDELMGQKNVKYETAGVLKDGTILWVLARIDEPVKIKGDDSDIYPFCMVATSHDGSRACSASATSVRVVCWNTFNASVDESKRSGLVYSFRHTQNVEGRIAEAKIALNLTRERQSEFIELANELIRHKVTDDGVKDFINQFIPDPPANVTTKRATNNVDRGRMKVFEILQSRSVPTAHKKTSYGLFCAGLEYLDHSRNFRNEENHFRRTIYDQNTLKPKVAKLAMKVAG